AMVAIAKIAASQTSGADASMMSQRQNGLASSRSDHGVTRNLRPAGVAARDRASHISAFGRPRDNPGRPARRSRGCRQPQGGGPGGGCGGFWAGGEGRRPGGVMLVEGGGAWAGRGGWALTAGCGRGWMVTRGWG